MVSISSVAVTFMRTTPSCTMFWIKACGLDGKPSSISSPQAAHWMSKLSKPTIEGTASDSNLHKTWLQCKCQPHLLTSMLSDTLWLRLRFWMVTVPEVWDSIWMVISIWSWALMVRSSTWKWRVSWSGCGSRQAVQCTNNENPFGLKMWCFSPWYETLPLSNGKTLIPARMPVGMQFWSTLSLMPNKKVAGPSLPEYMGTTNSALTIVKSPWWGCQ